MKKHMEQLGENLMKNLLNEIQDSKREMEEKLNHVMIQTKSYAQSVQIPHKRKIKLPMGHILTFVPSLKKCRISRRKREETPFQDPHYPWC